ncbi:hypothetical protein MKX01_029689 [Papaver californicum]|nr:hypothetical protein MKX01_029689 [Papaver californicum]
MSKIFKWMINNKQFRSTIVSLFRSSSSSLKLLFSKTLTSKQGSISHTTRVISSTHGGGARNLCSISSSPHTECEVNYQAYSSSSEVNGNIKKEEDLRTSIPNRFDGINV